MEKSNNLAGCIMNLLSTLNPITVAKVLKAGIAMYEIERDLHPERSMQISSDIADACMLLSSLYAYSVLPGEE